MPDLFQELGRVKCCVDGGQLTLLLFGEYSAVQQTLVWCLGCIKYLVHFGSVPALLYELQHRLEKVDIQPYQSIDIIQYLKRLSGTETIITYSPPYYRPVFLLYMAAIVLLVGA